MTRRRGVAGRVAAVHRRTPLRVRLVAAVLLLSAVGLGVAGTATAEALHGYLVGRVDDQLHRAATVIARAEARGFELRGPQPPPRNAFLRPPSAYAVQVVNAAGVPVQQAVDVQGTGTEPVIPALPIEQARARSGLPFTLSQSGTPWRALVVAFSDSSGSVTVAAPLGEVQHTVGRLVLLELGVGAAVLLLLGGLAYVVVRQSLRPLGDVEATAAAIAGGDLGRRVPEYDPRTEVGRLSTAVNGMLAQIEDAFRTRAASEAQARRSAERMRRFVADASHELRTPLTTIRGFAELYRQGASTSEADTARLMQRIEESARQMGLLVDDLLLLARLDQQRPLAREPVDLLALASDAVHDAQAGAPDHPITLEVAPGPPSVVPGDESRLRQVLANLLTNAVTHTPAGTAVTVRLATRADPGSGPPWAVLEVADGGPGLAAEEAERVFERFYRADPARAHDSRGPTGGTGLGLSIVAALTAAHGGIVQLDTEPGAGATFRVLLPLVISHPEDAAPDRPEPMAPEGEQGGDCGSQQLPSRGTGGFQAPVAG